MLDPHFTPICSKSVGMNYSDDLIDIREPTHMIDEEFGLG